MPLVLMLLMPEVTIWSEPLPVPVIDSRPFAVLLLTTVAPNRTPRSRS